MACCDAGASGISQSVGEIQHQRGNSKGEKGKKPLIRDHADQFQQYYVTTGNSGGLCERRMEWIVVFYFFCFLF